MRELNTLIDLLLCENQVAFDRSDLDSLKSTLFNFLGLDERLEIPALQVSKVDFAEWWPE